MSLEIVKDPIHEHCHLSFGDNIPLYMFWCQQLKDTHTIQFVLGDDHHELH